MIRRYTRPVMGALFTDEHKYETWLKVELAACAAWEKQGAIPKRAYERIRRKAKFKIERIEEIEARVHHDLVSFTTAVAESIGKDSAYFHMGLTSSDVVDTAQSLILKEAGQLLEETLGVLKTVVGRKAFAHRHTPCIGRTHGVHAEPTTFGLRLLVWYDELARHEERLAAAVDSIAVGKLSGAVGNFAHIPPKVEELVLKKLGLRPAPVSNQVVQRDRHAQFVTTLASLGATLEKIAVNLRTLQRTEIGEAQEPFAEGQKGSSAMPHKKNPVLLERICGLARVLRGYAVTALENVALWDERDISNSGAERVILPDACLLADYMLAKLTHVIENMVVRPERMQHNIHFTKGLVFSQRVLLALTGAGLSREEAYALVQRNAMLCWDEGAPLLDALLSDREVRAVLQPQEISALFSLEPYLAQVDEVFARVGLSSKTAKPKGRRSRRKPSAPSVLPTTEPAAAAIPVQNIDERPSDWYELAAPTVEELSPSPIEPDETLGEAEHQKKSPRKRVSRPAKTASSVKPSPTRKATEETTVKAAESEEREASKPRRRRSTRGGRRHKKPTDTGGKAAPRELKPSESSEDDTYVD